MTWTGQSVCHWLQRCLPSLQCKGTWFEDTAVSPVLTLSRAVSLSVSAAQGGSPTRGRLSSPLMFTSCSIASTALLSASRAIPRRFPAFFFVCVCVSVPTCLKPADVNMKNVFKCPEESSSVYLCFYKVVNVYFFGVLPLWLVCYTFCRQNYPRRPPVPPWTVNRTVHGGTPTLCSQALSNHCFTTRCVIPLNWQ